MKRAGLICALLIASLCGCAHTYVITMQNGRRITTASKPKLKEGNYVFKDAAGQLQYVPASRVREVAPESMSHSSTGGDFKKGPGW